jgi:hypothetical protein
VRYLEDMRTSPSKSIHFLLGDKKYPIEKETYRNAKFSLTIEGELFEFERKYHQYGVYLYLISHDDDFEWSREVKY